MEMEIDLCAPIISHHGSCSMGSKDLQSNEAIDFTVLDHGGLHLLFEAEGTSNPLDSPSLLYVTDVDSLCTVLVDGQALTKGLRTRIRPGAKLQLADGNTDGEFMVLRNVFAHA